MYPFLFNGNTSTGGYPLPPASVVLAPGDEITWAAAVFGPDNWQQNLKSFFPDLHPRHAVTGNPHGMPNPVDREIPDNRPDRVN